MEGWRIPERLRTNLPSTGCVAFLQIVGNEGCGIRRVLELGVQQAALQELPVCLHPDAGSVRKHSGHSINGELS